MNNYYTIKILSKEIQPIIKCSRFLYTFSAIKNALTICFEKDEHKYELNVVSEKGKIACYLQSHNKPPSGQKAFLFSGLNGRKVEALHHTEGERALELTLDDSKTLLISLFGSVANVYIVENGIITESFKQEKKWVGKSISDIFPPFSASDKVPKTAKQQLLHVAPKLPRHFLDELIHYHALDERSFGEIEQVAQEWIHILETQPQPRLLTDHRFTILPFEILPIEHKYTFESVNEAIRRSWSIVVNESKLSEQRQEWIGVLQNKVRYLEGLVEKAGQKQVQEEQARIWMEYGHLLMTQNPTKLGFPFIQLPNYFSDGEEVQIPLKQELTLAENATRYYNRSANAKKSVEILILQAKKAQEQLETVKPMLQSLVACFRYADLVQWKKKWESELKSLSNQKISDVEQEGFSVLTIKGYEVWLGRNAKSNELVVQKAHKEDIWLHARSVGGSHAILRMNKKREEPPKNVLEAVASLVAWHSQAKGSRLVPVQYTRRKFIRKPKGGAQGLVKVDKEEVLLVKPERTPD